MNKIDLTESVPGILLSANLRDPQTDDPEKEALDELPDEMPEDDIGVGVLNTEWPPTDVPADQFAEIMAKTLHPAFETERLLIFQIPVALPEARLNRLMFVAFATFDPTPTRVAATLVLSFGLMHRGLEVTCEWLEVMVDYRGQGIGIEFLIGVEKYTGWNIDLVDSNPKLLRAFREARLACKPPKQQER